MHPALHSIYRIILIDSFRRAGLCCTVPKRLSMKFNPDQEGLSRVLCKWRFQVMGTRSPYMMRNRLMAADQ